MGTARGRSRRPDGALLVAFILVGAAVSVALGVYGRVRAPTGRAPITLGFGSLIEMKVVLTTATGALGVLQVGTALRMYGGSAAAAALPWLGGTLFTVLVVVWLTSAG